MNNILFHEKTLFFNHDAYMNQGSEKGIHITYKCTMGRNAFIFWHNIFPFLGKHIALQCSQKISYAPMHALNDPTFCCLTIFSPNDTNDISKVLQPYLCALRMSFPPSNLLLILSLLCTGFSGITVSSHVFLYCNCMSGRAVARMPIHFKDFGISASACAC